MTPADGAAYADFRAPLTVRFNQSVDHAAAAASFALHDGAGAAVGRRRCCGRGPTRWSSGHSAAWPSGARYTATLGGGWRSAEGPLAPGGQHVVVVHHGRAADGRRQYARRTAIAPPT